MTIGIRDTRKIDAQYNMTETDVRHQARFEDSIGIYPEFIDGYGILILPTTGRYMHIPYRSMLPQGIKGLLIAGRATGGSCSSRGDAEHGCCAVSGQRAGIAAALAVKTKVRCLTLISRLNHRHEDFQSTALPLSSTPELPLSILRINSRGVLLPVEGTVQQSFL